jgi:hypothetical protein
MHCPFDSLDGGMRPFGFDNFTRSSACSKFTRENIYEIAPQGPFLKKIMRLEDPSEHRRLCELNSKKRKNFILNPDDCELHHEVKELLDLFSLACDGLFSNFDLESMSFNLDNLVGVVDSYAHRLAWENDNSILKLLLNRTWSSHLLILQYIMREFSRGINRLQRTRSNRYIITKVPELDAFIIVYPGSILKLHGNPAFYQLVHKSDDSFFKKILSIRRKVK